MLILLAARLSTKIKQATCSLSQCQQEDNYIQQDAQVLLLIAENGSIKFHLKKLSSPFTVCSSFSKVELILDLVKVGRQAPAFAFAKSLFDLPKELNVQHIEEHLSPQKEWKCPTEFERFSLRYLARNLLTYICRDFFVEKKYSVYAVHEKSGNQLPTSQNGIKEDSTQNSGHASPGRAYGQ